MKESEETSELGELTTEEKEISFENIDQENAVFLDIDQSLQRQLKMDIEQLEEEQGEPIMSSSDSAGSKAKKKKKTRVIVCSIILAFLLVIGVLLGTRFGRNLIYGLMGNYLYGMLDTKQTAVELDDENYDPSLRREKEIKNYLIMGIEEINGGGRTDSMMIVSINTKDDSIKLASLLRDTYVEIPGHGQNKLNAAYSKGGADLLVDTVEQAYKIKIEGYASVNFESFEGIIDRLDGVEIELGAKEAKYLNNTNYISNPKFRNVKEGLNLLNGNQALGYCRVRKVETLGGAHSDYGRTLRQRRVLRAVFEKYKSRNIVELMSITKDILQYIKTDLNADEISDMIDAMVENRITTMESERFPMNNLFTSTKNKAGSVLIPDWDANREKLYEFIYLDGDDETKNATVLEPTK